LLVPDGYNWRVNYNPTNIQLVVGNPGDFNFDGTVNTADYIVWRNNGWGPLNFSTWRANIGATYSGSGAAVPEPGTSVLFSMIVAGLALSGRRTTRRVRSAA
jgi:hypothetical protein